MILTFKEWQEQYGNNGCSPEYIKQQFNRVCGSKTFPIYPLACGMFELTEDFIQAYSTPDDKLWMCLYLFDFSSDLDIKNAEEVIAQWFRYEKYSMYNWNQEYLKEAIPRLFPDKEFKKGSFTVYTSDGKICGSSKLTHKQLIALEEDNWYEHHIAISKGKNKALRLIKESLTTEAHIEKPVRLWIGGWDDSSWAKCFDDADEPLKLIEKWKTQPPGAEDMKKLEFGFTN